MLTGGKRGLDLILLAVAGLAGSGIGYLMAPDNRYALAPGLIVGLVALFYRFPHLGFYALIFSFPFGAFRGKLHWMVAAALLIIVGARFWRKKEFCPQQLKSNLWPWLGAFLAVNFLSTILSPYPEEALSSLVFLLAGGLFFGLCLTLINRENLLSALPLVIVASITLGASLSVLGYLFDLSMFAVKVDKFKRGFGGTVSPNSLAVFIVSAIPFLLYYLLRVRRLSGYVLVLLALAINLAGLVTTYSRGGFWIMLFIVAATVLQYRFDWGLRQLATLALCGILYTGFAHLMVPSSNWREKQTLEKPSRSVEKSPPPAENYYWDRQKSLSDSEDFSLNRRSTYLEVGWQALRRRPLLGWGPMTFKYIYGDSESAREFLEESNRKNTTPSNRVAHNTYLEVLVGSGLMGLILFLCILLRALVNFTQAHRLLLQAGDRHSALLVAAYRLSFFSMLVYFLIQSMLYHKPFLLMLAISQVVLASVESSIVSARREAS